MNINCCTNRDNDGGGTRNAKWTAKLQMSQPKRTSLPGVLHLLLFVLLILLLRSCPCSSCYCFPPRVSFSLSSASACFPRRPAARHLAEEVCRKGNYFMNCWVKARSPNVFCFKDVIGAYPENFEFIDWLTEQPLDSACFSAGVGVRALVPSDMVGV